jgi:hypothetical protein
LDGTRRREAKVSDVGGIDGRRPLPTLYTAIAEIYRFRSANAMIDASIIHELEDFKIEA